MQLVQPHRDMTLHAMWIQVDDRLGSRLQLVCGRVTRPAIHNLRVPVASVSRPQGGGLLAVLWPPGWVY